MNKPMINSHANLFNGDRDTVIRVCLKLLFNKFSIGDVYDFRKLIECDICTLSQRV